MPEIDSYLQVKGTPTGLVDVDIDIIGPGAVQSVYTGAPGESLPEGLIPSPVFSVIRPAGVPVVLWVLDVTASGDKSLYSSSNDSCTHNQFQTQCYNIKNYTKSLLQSLERIFKKNSNLISWNYYFF